MTTSTEAIAEKLRRFILDDMGCAISVADTETWENLPDCPSKHMGIYDPLPDLEVPFVIGVFPPQIDWLLDGIDPVDRDRYLDILCFVAAQMVLIYDVIEDAADRWRRVEAMILDQHEDTTRVWIEVSMRAMGLQ